MIRIVLISLLVAYTASAYVVHQHFTLRLKALEMEVAHARKEIADYKDIQKRKVTDYVQEREEELEQCLAFAPQQGPPVRKPTWRERLFKPKPDNLPQSPEEEKEP
ncbi:MAG: hypothetical protein OEZ28_04130 [Nitrospinota bacterium]|nr:hypothetical protein [Nitrospinota bacterium]